MKINLPFLLINTLVVLLTTISVVLLAYAYHYTIASRSDDPMAFAVLLLFVFIPYVPLLLTEAFLTGIYQVIVARYSLLFDTLGKRLLLGAFLSVVAFLIVAPPFEEVPRIIIENNAFAILNGMILAGYHSACFWLLRWIMMPSL